MLQELKIEANNEGKNERKILRETLKLVKNVFDEFEVPYYSKEGIENFYKFADYNNILDKMQKNAIAIFVEYDDENNTFISDVSNTNELKEKRNKIIGMIAVSENKHIAMLFVDKNYHNLGIGRRLLNRAIDYCIEKNSDIKEITINSSPYAIGFYHKAGFKDTANVQVVDGITFTPMSLSNLKKNAYGELMLITPNDDYKEQVMNYRKVLLENNEPFDGCSGLEECYSYEEWLDFENRLSKKYKDSYVPSKVYLIIRKNDNKLIGLIDFRLKLSDFVYEYGGNIGYSILPEERRKGYAKEALRLLLIECKKTTDIRRVLITCDKENIASKNTILANGGVLENEVEDISNLSKSGTIQRYWISLKKRKADYVRKDKTIISVNQKCKSFANDDFMGDVYLNEFIKISKPFILENGVCIRDNGYKWLEFYDYNAKVLLTTIYNEKNKLVEWYFDISKEVGKEYGVPYQDDLYLDVVLRLDGTILLLDEDELLDALNRREITKEEFDGAYEIANDLISKISGKEQEIKKFTDKYLNMMME